MCQAISGSFGTANDFKVTENPLVILLVDISQSAALGADANKMERLLDTSPLLSSFLTSFFLH